MELNKILTILKSIAEYMDKREIYDGEDTGNYYTERNIKDELNALIGECEGSQSNSKPANCAIFDVSQRSELLLAFLKDSENFDYVEIHKSNFAKAVEDYLANNCG